ncbi:MAG: heme ABC transporter permease CcmC [Alphaproteobacteria bacterium]
MSHWLKVIAAVNPWLGGIGGMCLLVGLGWALYFSPPDYQQGEVVRIMYVHVPASWGALAIYMGMGLASGAAFVMRTITGHLVAKAFSLIGMTLTGISLVTGAIWGMPTWGTWWVWDARLTSMLLLFFLYCGYSFIVRAFDDADKGLQAGGVLIMLGSINIPIIKWSVDWWHTLHQPASLLRFAKPAIHGQFLGPLLTMAVAFLLLGLWMGLLRLRTLLLTRKLMALHLRQQSNSQWKQAA